ncbi:MAG: GPW/gp25 family protein [Eubacterium sp.]|nr:GPW/gp25 family protein [Eubacterium sp.]MCM1213099.1 GPW/gp25 family protein [Lachnospiraceae bacterium]MCM1239405.1 GPW/gp25 family protein [Lachnospiraceae bacterium]
MAEGWHFPFEISKKHGRVETSSDSENIRQSVKIILLTEPGERMMHPKFGTKLRQFLFENMDSQTREMICREVRGSLQMWEKRIRDIRVDARLSPESQGKLHVAVTYHIAGREEEERIEVTVT